MPRNDFTCRSIEQKRRDHLVPYLFIAPFIISFLAFFAFPAGYSLVLSFFRYRGYGKAVFVGFSNYQSLLNYSSFWKSIGNTLFYFLAHIVPVMSLSFLFATTIQAPGCLRLKKIFKPILFLPQVVPVMASVLTFRVIFATNTGAVNQLFNQNIRWLEEPTLMRLIVIAYTVWRSTGWFMVIYLAGLTTINPTLYESATLDGASGLQKNLYITIPLMRPIFIFAFIMDAISSFKIYTEANVLFHSLEPASTDVAPIMNMVTNNIKNGQFGMSSAAGWLLFVMILIISGTELLFMREKGVK